MFSITARPVGTPVELRRSELSPSLEAALVAFNSISANGSESDTLVLSAFVAASAERPEVALWHTA